MAKAEFNRDAAILYAKLNGIKLPKEIDDDDLIYSVKKFVGVQPDTCDCKSHIRDDDRMCWYCGGDVANTKAGAEPGGYEVMLEEWEHGQGKKEKVEKKEAELADLREEAESADIPENEIESAPEPEEEQEVPAEEKPGKKETKVKKSSLQVVKSDPLPVEPEKAPRSVKKGELTLDKRIDEIRALSGQTAISAWKIGKHLFEINEKQLYKEKECETFEAFCKENLGYSRATAYNFMRIAQRFDLEQAKKLGLFHLIALSSGAISDKDRERIFDKAESDGLTCDELREEIKEAKEKDPNAKPKPERKVVSPYKHLVGAKVEGKYDRQDPQLVVLMLDDSVSIKLKVLKTKVSAEFVPTMMED